MTQSHGAAHVYLREIREGERTSLSVLVDQIPLNASVLDLGTGSGALGQYLQSEKACVVDGVTYNPAEKEHAAPFYRRLDVADLDTCDLAALFAGQHYDFIVCADVLEHLRAPERILQAARQLLAPMGRLLISVPNAAYAGLVGELMTGEFRYREEGLLDETHLRFFTRRSLGRFLREGGWVPEAIDTIQRPLPQSEFQLQFDSLPPAVARYLLARPDALAYQFIVNALPALAGATVAPTQAENDPTDAPDAKALFTLQLYLGHEGDFAEDRKLTARGVIGQAQQTVNFTLLPDGRPFDAIRLDPADRPGFLQLFRVALRATDGKVLWQWSSDTDGLAALAGRPHQQMVLADGSPLARSAMVLLYGDDPWIELPIPGAALAQAAASEALRLDVELGWPMSADYLALAAPVAAHLREADRAMGVERIAAATERERLVQARELDLDAQRVRFETALQRERVEMTGALERERLEMTGALERERLDLTEALQRERSEHAATLQRERAELAEVLQRERSEHDQTLQRERGERDETLAQGDRARTEIESTLAAVRTQAEAQRLHNRTLAAQKSELATLLDQTRSHLTREHDALLAHLHEIENSTVFRATRPLVRAKIKFDRLRRTLSAARPQPTAAPLASVLASPRSPASAVDVIVPVYRGLDDTRRCIEAVLAHPCRTPWRLVVINDASPEPEVTEWLRAVAARDLRIVLLENTDNLGFVATVNRGMALHSDNDVVLLNSDAEVANDWLDRLHRAAYAHGRVASVTPFSNNATICSYPRFCEDNPLPAGYDVAALDALFATANTDQVVDVPTGVGFCMYIRRDALRDVGLFDVETFGRGYGEENDFCCRAAAAGWRNLHALDTFVRHAGGVSFGAEKSERELAAMATLRRVHPDYERQVHAFVAADPARSPRHLVDLERLRTSALPRVLVVVHALGGGTQRHVTELAGHLQSRAISLSLAPLPDGKVQLRWLDPKEAFELAFTMPAEVEALLQVLRNVGVSLVHYHHLLGHDPLTATLHARLGIPFDFTAHDYFAVCPQITLTDSSGVYCGELGVAQCHRCLANRPAPDGSDIETWRLRNGQFLTDARHVLVPSRDAARRLARYIPSADIRLAPHTDLPVTAVVPVPKPAPLAPQAHLRILVIGALSQIKGADALEAAAMEAARTGAPLEFHLVGYAYRALQTQPRASLTVHGAYAEKDLPALLDRLRPDVVWFPAQWPETYSYTLSACLQAGTPVIAPDLGAFADRLQGRPWTWIRPVAATPADQIAFLEAIRSLHFVTGIAPLLPSAPTGSAMDALVGPWSYEGDYLHGLSATTGVEMAGTVPRALIDAHLPSYRRPESAPSTAAAAPGWMRRLYRHPSASGLRRVAQPIRALLQR